MNGEGCRLLAATPPFWGGQAIPPPVCSAAEPPSFALSRRAGSHRSRPPALLAYECNFKKRKERSTMTILAILLSAIFVSSCLCVRQQLRAAGKISAKGGRSPAGSAYCQPHTIPSAFCAPHGSDGGDLPDGAEKFSTHRKPCDSPQKNADNSSDRGA